MVFKVKFEALVFRPFKGEILDGMVTDVTGDGIFIESGPLKSFISKQVRVQSNPERDWRMSISMTWLTTNMRASTKQ